MIYQLIHIFSTMWLVVCAMIMLYLVSGAIVTFAIGELPESKRKLLWLVLLLISVAVWRYCDYR